MWLFGCGMGSCAWLREGGFCEGGGRQMQKLFPAAVPVSEKLEVLTFLSQSIDIRTDRRLK